MSHPEKPWRSGLRACVTMLRMAGLAALCAIVWPVQAVSRTQPPWHIESFCHRDVPSARRCLVRARQGILVFQLAELASAPTVRWSDGVAVLTSGKDARSRQLRFFIPPQKLSAPFRQVLAYDIPRQLVAIHADGGVHVRAMFAADERDLAALALPAGIGTDTLRVSFAGRDLRTSWQDSHGRSHEQMLYSKH